MRRRLILLIAIGTGGLALCVGWLVFRNGSMTSRNTEPKAKTAPATHRPQIPEQPQIPDRTRPRANPPEAPPKDPQDAEARPSVELGDSQDPDRLAKARIIYDEALAELQALGPGASPREAAEIYRKGASALERVEDETPRDDLDGQARLRRDLEELRKAVQRVARPSQ